MTTRPWKYPPPKVGDQYGQWTVLAVPTGLCGSVRLPCLCSCGRVFTVKYGHLVGGKSMQCRQCNICQWNRTGLRASHETIRVYGFIPEEHRVRLYSRAKAAIRRCSDPKCHNHARYGGRGIAVCPAWREDNTLFIKYLMTLPGWDNPDLQIDRIDNDGNYEPGNIRFVTQTENQRNRSDRRGDSTPRR